LNSTGKKKRVSRDKGLHSGRKERKAKGLNLTTAQAGLKEGFHGKSRLVGTGEMKASTFTPSEEGGEGMGSHVEKTNLGGRRESPLPKKKDKRSKSTLFDAKKVLVRKGKNKKKRPS